MEFIKDYARRFVVGKKRPLAIASVLIISSFFFNSTSQDPLSIPQSIPIAVTNPDGSVTLTIAIEAPRGTGGATPDLSLVYNSRTGEGFLGRGWHISGLPFITRDPSRNINYQASDRYISSMHGELVNIGNYVFHSKEESLFRYIPLGNCGEGPCSWTVNANDGSIYYFGNSEDSRIDVAGKEPAVRTWALHEYKDPSGNSYTVTYVKDNGEYYPSSIEYSDRKISFNYTVLEEGVFDYSQNATVKIYKQLQSVVVSTDSGFTSSYEFSYQKRTNQGYIVLLRSRKMIRISMGP